MTYKRQALIKAYKDYSKEVRRITKEIKKLTKKMEEKRS